MCSCLNSHPCLNKFMFFQEGAQNLELLLMFYLFTACLSCVVLDV